MLIRLCLLHVFLTLGCAQISFADSSSEIYAVVVDDFKSRLTIARISSIFVSTGQYGTDTSIIRGRDEFLNTLRESKSMQAQFRQDYQAATGNKAEPGFAGIKQVIESRYAEEVASAKRNQFTSRHEFTNGPIPQIIHYGEGTKKSSDVLRLLQFGLEHPLLRGDSLRWTIITPGVETNNDVVSQTTNIKLKGMMPPGFEHFAIDCEHKSGIELLFDDPSRLQSYGRYGGYELMGRTLDDGEMCIVAGFSSSGTLTAIPQWIAVASGQLILKKEFETLVDFIKRLESGEPEAAILAHWAPLRVTQFKNFREYSDVGLYPLDLIQVGVSAASEGVEMAGREFHELKLSDLVTNMEVPAVERIEIINGMSYLDRDTDVGYIVGEKIDQHFLKFVGRNRSLLVFFTFLVVATILFSVFLRMKRHRAYR